MFTRSKRIKTHGSRLWSVIQSPASGLWLLDESKTSFGKMSVTVLFTLHFKCGFVNAYLITNCLVFWRLFGCCSIEFNYWFWPLISHGLFCSCKTKVKQLLELIFCSILYTHKTNLRTINKWSNEDAFFIQYTMY